MSKLSSIKNLESHGFVSVDYPVELRSAVEKTAELWKAFYALPLEIKEIVQFNKALSVGYELKEGTGPKGDRKENFDVALAGIEWLEVNARKSGNRVVEEFVHSAAGLVHIMKPFIVDFARHCESAFDMTGFAREVEESVGSYFPRYIHYIDANTVGEEIASAHVDQSGCTLHLFESSPGLQCLMHDGVWMDMPVSPGKTVIIPDMQMQLRSEGRLKATCHRVVTSEETCRKGERDSAVVFIQFKDTPKYDKDTHGRLQEKEPGFNYGLSQEEFGKLFK